mmetsp:Transcript_17391/g.33208  ORF Transcript_17391/g.33208 Transcript_17391/m.33208 type:complete len:296 (+) Transcript_17391:315-1202(+)
MNTGGFVGDPGPIVPFWLWGHARGRASDTMGPCIGKPCLGKKTQSYKPMNWRWQLAQAGAWGLSSAGGALSIGGEQIRPQANRQSGENDWMKDRRRRATNVILALNGVCFLGQVLSGGRLTILGSKVNHLLDKGQYWRLWTPCLLHVNFIHLVMNSYSLHSIGPAWEAIAGRDRFIATYVAGGIAGNLLSWRMAPNPSVGASAAICGVVGGLTVFYYRHKEMMGKPGAQTLQKMQKLIVLNAIFGMVMSKNIDNWGHAGGLLGGAAMAWAVGPDYTKFFLARRHITRKLQTKHAK